MPRFLAWLLAALLLGCFAAVALFLLRQRAASGKGMPDYSVFSESAYGLGESANVLRQAGYRVVALTRPVQHTQRQGLLIAVQPHQEETFGSGMGEADARGLLGWVERGNTLLLCASVNTPVHQLLGVLVTTPASEGESFVSVALDRSSPYLEDVERLSVGQEATLSAPRRGGATVLWRVAGQPGALRIDWGKGRVLLVADPVLLTRRGLVREDGEARDDNVVFLANVVRLHAQDAKVFFDEYHHGLKAPVGFWSYLGHYQQRWTLLPVLIVVAAVVWRVAVRLGPGVHLSREVRADAVDFASALARLYQKAGARKLLARILTRDFLGHLTAHLHLRRGTLPALILSAWKQQDPGSRASRLQELLQGVAELRKAEVTDRQLLHWAQAFHDFVQEIQTTHAERGA